MTPSELGPDYYSAIDVAPTRPPENACKAAPMAVGVHQYAYAYHTNPAPVPGAHRWIVFYCQWCLARKAHIEA